MKKIIKLFALFLITVYACDMFAAKPVVITRKTLDYDHCDTSRGKVKKLRSGIAGYFEYNVEIPESGWYTYQINKARSGLRYELFVDGVETVSWATRADDRIGKSYVSFANIHLNKGKHTLRLQRIGFPGAFTPSWRLVKSTGPATSIQGKLISHDVVRAGKELVFNIQGSGPEPMEFTVMTRKAGDNNWVKAGRVDFPASALPVTRQARIVCPDEGTYTIRLFNKGKKLPPYLLHTDAFAVVDTRKSVAPEGNIKTRLVYDIDCVKLTNNGTKLIKGENFWEANGESRVTTSPAGKYRETAPSKIDPNSADSSVKFWGISTGMGFALDDLDMNKLYLAEVDYPDDTRRTVNVGIYANSSRGGSAPYLSGSQFPFRIRNRGLVQSLQ